MTSSPDEVCAASRDRRPAHQSGSTLKAAMSSKPCNYCNRLHAKSRDACPAYGKTCRRCGKDNHFANSQVCCEQPATSGRRKPPRGKPELHAASDSDCSESNSGDELLTVDEELLTLGSNECWYTQMAVDGHTVRFMLDCGTTCNIIPYALIAEIGRTANIIPTKKKFACLKTHSSAHEVGLILNCVI